jgi:hypothetical protein
MRFTAFVKKLEVLQYTKATAAGLRERIAGCSVAGHLDRVSKRQGMRKLEKKHRITKVKCSRGKA